MLLYWTNKDEIKFIILTHLLSKLLIKFRHFPLHCGLTGIAVPLLRCRRFEGFKDIFFSTYILLLTAITQNWLQYDTWSSMK
jgi:hypothetical protein